MDNHLPYEPKTIEFTIDGVTYTKKEILFTQRNELLFKIAQLAGAGAPGLKTMNDDVNFGEIIQGILFKYSPQEAATFIKSTIKLGLQYPDFEKLGDRAFELHFTEHYDHQVEVLGEIWKQNFGQQIDILKKKYSTLNLIIQGLSGLMLNTQTNPPASTQETP
jgi:hypothetical protein